MQNLTFQVNLTDNSNYEWNCEVCDIDDNCNFSTSNYTFIINSSYNAPPQIILQYPPHNEPNIELSPTLNVTVIDPEGTNMNVTFYGREKNDTNFTIIALPDTQNYVNEDNPDAWAEIFTNITKWINNSKEEKNIVFVTHEGDIVQNYNDIEQEWIEANESMSVLDGQVPYGVLPGNHDMGDGGIQNGKPGTSTALYNKYFNYTRYEGVYDWYKGNYDRNDNNYQFFTAGGVDYLIMHLEFQASANARNWANQILQTYKNRSAIITTHDYLEVNGERRPYGNTLWNDIIYPNSNVFLVLAGHSHATGDGEARRVDNNNFGNPVHQIMADYQEGDSGGSGFIRVMEFAPAEKKIYVRTYSSNISQSNCNAGSFTDPLFTNAEFKWREDGCYKNDTNSEFILDYTPFNYLNQTSNVESGDNATYLWKDRKASTTYEWFVDVVDMDGVRNDSQVWNFTTTTPSPPPP